MERAAAFARMVRRIARRVRPAFDRKKIDRATVPVRAVGGRRWPMLEAR